jgi:hypothetical protein
MAEPHSDSGDALGFEEHAAYYDDHRDYSVTRGCADADADTDTDTNPDTLQRAAVRADIEKGAHCDDPKYAHIYEAATHVPPFILNLVIGGEDVKYTPIPYKKNEMESRHDPRLKGKHGAIPFEEDCCQDPRFAYLYEMAARVHPVLLRRQIRWHLRDDIRELQRVADFSPAEQQRFIEATQWSTDPSVRKEKLKLLGTLDPTFVAWMYKLDARKRQLAYLNSPPQQQQ